MKVKHYTLSALAAAMIFAGGASIAAETETDTIQVTAEVVAACVIDTTNPLEFGQYNPVSGEAVTADTTIGVRCTNGHPYTVGLDFGTSANESTRRMEHDEESGEFLTYELYTDELRTAVWGNATGAWVDGTGNGSEQSRTIYGRVAANQSTALIGSYSDTVTVTVSY